MLDTQHLGDPGILRSHDEAQWISLSDLMTSLMMIFLLLAIMFMLRVHYDAAHTPVLEHLHTDTIPLGSDERPVRSGKETSNFIPAPQTESNLPSGLQTERHGESQYITSANGTQIVHDAAPQYMTAAEGLATLTPAFVTTTEGVQTVRDAAPQRISTAVGLQSAQAANPQYAMAEDLLFTDQASVSPDTSSMGMNPAPRHAHTRHTIHTPNYSTSQCTPAEKQSTEATPVPETKPAESFNAPVGSFNPS